MNLQEIAKELKKKAERQDKKGILKLFRLLKYDFDLGSLQPKLDNLISEVKNWKWPSLTGKFEDKENLKKWANGEPVPPHRTIIDDICGFTELLRGKAQENLTDTGQNGGKAGKINKKVFFRWYLEGFALCILLPICIKRLTGMSFKNMFGILLLELLASLIVYFVRKLQKSV